MPSWNEGAAHGSRPARPATSPAARHYPERQLSLILVTRRLDCRSRSREAVSLFLGRRNNSVVATKPFSLAREETLKQSPGINTLG